MIKLRVGSWTTWFRWGMLAGAVVLTAGGVALVVQGRELFLAFWYFAIAATWAFNGWSVPSWWRRGYNAGYRKARIDLWFSFHEGVFVRKLGPFEWLSAEADRDIPRIVAFGTPPEEE